MVKTKESNSNRLSNNGVEKDVGLTTYERAEEGNVLPTSEWAEIDDVAKIVFTPTDQRDMQQMGKRQEFRVRAYWLSAFLRH